MSWVKKGLRKWRHEGFDKGSDVNLSLCGFKSDEEALEATRRVFKVVGDGAMGEAT